MKIVVEVDDFWMDSDSDSFKEEFKKYISDCTTREIYSRIREKVETEISEVIESNIKNGLKESIENMSKEFLSSDKVIENRYSKEKVSVDDYISGALQANLNSYSQSGFRSFVEKRAELFTKEFRERYDLMFASQIVIKMNEQGLLKEGVFESLMSKNDKQNG